jgi:DNA-binding transcriptional MocR family regulator
VTKPKAEPEDLAPAFDAALFDELFGYLDEQVQVEAFQVIFRLSWMPWSDKLSPQAWAQQAKLAVLDSFAGTEQATYRQISTRIRLDKRNVDRIRRSTTYKQIFDDIISFRQELMDPKTWNEHAHDKIVQDRTAKRTISQALQSKNPKAISEAIGRIADRAAPIIKTQQPIIQIVLSKEDQDLEASTIDMIEKGGRFLTEGE